MIYEWVLLLYDVDVQFILYVLSGYYFKQDMDNKQILKKFLKKSVILSDKNNNKIGNKKKKKNRKLVNKLDQKDSDQSLDILEIEGFGVLDNM